MSARVFPDSSVDADPELMCSNLSSLHHHQQHPRAHRRVWHIRRKSNDGPLRRAILHAADDQDKFTLKHEDQRVVRRRVFGTTAGTLPREELNALIRMGVNGILTDVPEVLAPLLADLR